MGEKKEEKVKEETRPVRNEFLNGSSCGMKPNLAATLSYLFGWVSGLLFFLVEKKSKYVRFHALQSVITFGFLNVLYFVLRLIFSSSLIGLRIINAVIGIVFLVLWITLMVNSYQENYFKLGIAGKISEENAEIKS